MIDTKIAPKNWYIEVNKLLLSWAEEYNLTLEQVCGIFATLSPQKNIQWNLKQTREVLDFGVPKTGMFSGAEISKCKRILQGEGFEDITGKNSHKIRNFYLCCLRPNDPTPCCIDTHIIRYLQNRYKYSLLNKYTKAQIFRSKRLYNHCVKLLKSEAQRVDTTPSAYQAQIWCEVRGKAL